MQLKTSFFNPTVYKKNLFRFAPVWLCYTLCLVLGLVLMYANGGTLRQFWFATHMAEIIPIMGVINLAYALLTAQLLFGDLFNSRMCNALHAMPLKRDGWFFTHIASGMTFSLIPTAVMSALSLPLLAGSLFDGAWKIAFYFFVASNLQYLCLFGIAVFSVMVTGNRFAMAAGYGLINFGAQIVYFLIDTIYTPMLYGVITPYTLAKNLTPVLHMTDNTYVDMDNLSELQVRFGSKLEGAVGSCAMSGNWHALYLCAGAGIAFLLAALVLYKKRDLECAGDAVAFRFLIPLFQIPCAIVVAAATQFFLENFLGVYGHNFLILGIGLVVGWFTGKMLVERTTRVFRLKNWYGLAALFAAIGLSLLLTHIDILNIETSQPDAEEIQSVTIDGTELTNPEDIQLVLQLQNLALETRLEDYQNYVRVDGQLIPYQDYVESQIEAGVEGGTVERVYATQFHITYELENGKIIRRFYNVWSESEAGDILRELTSRWEVISNRYNYQPLVEKGINLLEHVLTQFREIYYNGAQVAASKQYQSLDDAKSLLEAIRADCDARLLAQDSRLHNGFFRFYDASYQKGYYDNNSLYLCIEGKEYTWSVDIYADSVNTIRWLQDRGLLAAEVHTENTREWR